jgi:hypothetical protein
MRKFIHSLTIFILSYALCAQVCAGIIQAFSVSGNVALRPMASSKQADLLNSIKADTPVMQDTTLYKEIGIGDIIELESLRYKVIENAEPPAVKKACEIATGKIVWLKFQRDITASEREADVLSLLRRKPLSGFCKGKTLKDKAGNIVNVIDNIEGSTLYQIVTGSPLAPEEYFERHFIDIAKKLIIAGKALALFHEEFTQAHGDVHSHNILIEESTGRPFWIDFHVEGDLMYLDIDGFINMLLFLALKPDGGLERYNIGDFPDEEFADWEISWDDETIINAKRFRSYIPDDLNAIFLRSSRTDENEYKNIRELISDLEKVVLRMERTKSKKPSAGFFPEPGLTRNKALSKGLSEQRRHARAISQSS